MHLAHEEIAYKMLRSGATYSPEAANAAQLTGKIHMLIMVLFPLHHFELVQDMFFLNNQIIDLLLAHEIMILLWQNKH